MRSLLVLVLLLAAACTPTTPESALDGSLPATSDSGTAPAADSGSESGDAAAPAADAGSESRDAATPAPDAGASAPDAGPGVCTPGASTACTGLGALWKDGTATCRASGNGWDVTSCQRAGTPGRRITETVRPALRDPRWDQARCNVGDEFVFQVTFPPVPPDGALPTQWVLALEGGGFCAFDTTSELGGCGNRAVDLVSSVNLPADRTLEERNPGPADDFSGAIHVLGQYCSSDLWTGANPDAGSVLHKGQRRPWRYQGSRNVEAMLQVLVERYGLDDTKDLEVLWRGGSAGGFGAFNNAFRVVRHLPRTARSGRLLAFPAAGYVALDWDEPAARVLGLGSALTAFGTLVETWKSELTPQCTSKRTPGDPLHPPHECIAGPVLYPILTAPEAEGGFDLPTLVWQNRQDQLYMSNSSLPPQAASNTPEQVTLRARWAQAMTDAMGITGRNSSRTIAWLYAPSDPMVVRPDGSAEPNVHGAFLYADDPPTGAEHSLDAVLHRFWTSMRGLGPGRGRKPGEVHTFDCNWVPDRDGAGCE